MSLVTYIEIIKYEKARTLVFGFALLFLLFISAAAQPGYPDFSFGNLGKVVTLDNSFFYANDTAIEPDGKIVVVGQSLDSGGSLDFMVVRYAANGALDTTFNGTGIVVTPSPASTESAEAVAVQPDGKILVGGWTISFNISRFLVVRYNADGSLDSSFGIEGRVFTAFQNSSGEAYDLLLQPNGKIVLVGYVYNTTTGEDFCLVRYNADGSPDTGFGTGGVSIPVIEGGFQRAYSAALTGSNSIVVAGCADCGSANSDFAIAIFDSTGAIFRGGYRTTPIGSGEDAAFGVAVQRDGKIVAAGTTQNGSRTDTALVRYNSNGTLDTTFGGDGIVVKSQANSVYTNDVAVQANGRIIVAGYFHNPSLEPSLYFIVQRFNQDGSNDTPFGAGNGQVTFSVVLGRNCRVNAIALQTDGRIVAVGYTQGEPGGFALMRLYGDFRERADFDGDGRTDLSIFRPSNGQWWYQNSFNSTVSAFQFGVSSDRITPGDYDGDGRADAAFWRSSTGEWFALRSSNATFFSVPFGSNGDIPAPGDFDGDGKTDFTVFRPSSGTWYISKTSGGTTIFQWGTNGDLPVVGDYDGDARADVGIFRPSDGSWWINRSSFGTFVAAFGTGTDKPVPGDYTGDNKTDVAVWRPSNGTWYVLRSENQGFFSVPFGANGDVPTPGNFDGDNKTDFAVFRPSAATWYVAGSRGGTIIQQFGANGDIPVPKAYVP